MPQIYYNHTHIIIQQSFVDRQAFYCDVVHKFNCKKNGGVDCGRKKMIRENHTHANACTKHAYLHKHMT